MSSGKLALLGGTPVRTKPWPLWPVYDEREMNALREVLESRQWCRLGGKKVDQFEQAFARYQDAQYGIAVANGTAALEVTLKAAGVEAGDEVIVPAFTFIATATAPLQISAIPIFADVDPDTINMDPKSVEKLITDRTRAIMPVHFGGRAADMDGLLDLARRHSLVVIEDACHGWGATWKGRKVGAIGLAGGVSFQQSKNMTAGEGGFILTNDADLAARCDSLQSIGRIKGRPFYLAQLERIEEQTQRRWENACFLDRLLKDCPCVSLLRNDPWVTRSSVHVYMLRYGGEAESGVSRDVLLKALDAEGVPAWGGYPHPLYRNPLFSEMNFGRKGHPYTCSLYGGNVDYTRCDCPVTEQFCKEAICLSQPLFLAEKDDMRDIARAVEKVWEHRAALRAEP
jgi:dTDP-4-amino-4,6-dideoxygalactose transaminase